MKMLARTGGGGCETMIHARPAREAIAAVTVIKVVNPREKRAGADESIDSTLNPIAHVPSPPPCTALTEVVHRSCSNKQQHHGRQGRSPLSHVTLRLHLRAIKLMEASRADSERWGAWASFRQITDTAQHSRSTQRQASSRRSHFRLLQVNYENSCRESPPFCSNGALGLREGGDERAGVT